MKFFVGVGPSFLTSVISVRYIPVLHFQSPHVRLIKAYTILVHLSPKTGYLNRIVVMHIFDHKLNQSFRLQRLHAVSSTNL